ncbi:MAG: hypothetical protein AAF773_28755 [Cyanobacteria bacterium P01_D01_bin.115]
MMNCPCCADELLRHVAPSGLYWFCPTCRQAMPVGQAMGAADRTCRDRGDRSPYCNFEDS